MIARRLSELSGAFCLLTRLPLRARALASALSRTREKEYLGQPADCVWAYPIVGAVVGAIGASAYWLARAAAVPPLLAAIWAIAAMIAATGGFHEDGLADTADGFGGGASRACKLDIMRDSRIGTFGVLALVFSLAIRVGAIVAIGERGHIAAALVATGALGRAAMLPSLLLLHPARADGLGATVSAPALPRALAAIGLAATVALILLPPPTAALAIGSAAAAGLVSAWFARTQIGGYTGDVLGAAEQVAECGVLTLLAQQFRVGGV